MKKAILVVSIILVSMLAGCGNVSATRETLSTTTQEIEEESTESSTTIINEEVAAASDEAKNVDASWEDYVDSDGVFNMDSYAEALGYTVIKADKSHSWYIYDTIKYHYCIVASGPTLNAMFDSFDVGYAINIVDDRDNPLSAKICTQSQTVTTSNQWINESSMLLKFIADNSPSEEEIRNYSGIKTIHLSCTKWSECFVTDERGVIIDNNGKAEPLWNRNWEND